DRLSGPSSAVPGLPTTACASSGLREQPTPSWTGAVGYPPVVRLGLLITGIALLVVGVIWIFQGLDVLKGSFMTGEILWAWMGALAVLLGLPLVLRGLRRG